MHSCDRLIIYYKVFVTSDSVTCQISDFATSAVRPVFVLGTSPRDVVCTLCKYNNLKVCFKTQLLKFRISPRTVIISNFFKTQIANFKFPPHGTNYLVQVSLSACNIYLRAYLYNSKSKVKTSVLSALKWHVHPSLRFLLLAGSAAVPFVFIKHLSMCRVTISYLDTRSHKGFYAQSGPSAIFYTRHGGRVLR